MTDPSELRQQVAHNRGLPAALADRLKGTTREELEADADTLRAAVSPPEPVPDFHGGARQPAVDAEDVRFDQYMRLNFPRLFREGS